MKLIKFNNCPYIFEEDALYKTVKLSWKLNMYQIPKSLHSSRIDTYFNIFPLFRRYIITKLYDNISIDEDVCKSFDSVNNVKLHNNKFYNKISEFTYNLWLNREYINKLHECVQSILILAKLFRKYDVPNDVINFIIVILVQLE